MITDVGIDMDGVLFDFATEFYNYASDLTPLVHLAPPRRWDFYLDWGWDSKTFERRLDEATEKGLFRTASPMFEAEEGWKRLKDMGLKLHVLTHRKPNAYRDTVDWLIRNDMVPDGLHFGNYKGILADIAEEEAAGIDDYIVYYKQYQEVGVKSFLMTQPWNREFTARRVLSLTEFADAVEIHNKYHKMEEQA